MRGPITISSNPDNDLKYMQGVKVNNNQTDTQIYKNMSEAGNSIKKEDIEYFTE